MSSPDSLKTTARQAGFWYLLLLFLAPFNEFYLKRRFLVPGDAAATLRNIADDQLTYRLGQFSNVLSNVVFLVVALLLYHLFRDTNRKQARLMVTLVMVPVTLSMAIRVCEIAPLVLLGRAAYLSAFTPPQIEALAMVFLRLGSAGTVIAMLFWGLWLCPFGILVIQSGFFPKWLGWLLIVGSITYSALGFIGLVFPHLVPLVSPFAMPFYAAGELAIILWLVFKGANVPATTSSAG